MDQSRLFIYGLFGHEFCGEEMKGFNLCQAQVPFAQAAPEMCEKQSNLLLDKFFQMKLEIKQKCQNEFEAIVNKVSADQEY